MTEIPTDGPVRDQPPASTGTEDQITAMLIANPRRFFEGTV
jgi:hypothetical protein